MHHLVRKIRFCSQCHALTLSDRLPTVSASQALQNLTNSQSKHIRTGLQTLDALLASGNRPDDEVPTGGIERGKVTELWGPTGAGKTAIALEVAVNVVNDGGAVVWVDAIKPLCEPRVESILARKSSPRQSIEEPSTWLHHIPIVTLSHLLAMALHPPPGLLPYQTGLLVVDGLNALLDIDYPRYQLTAPNKTEQQKWQAGRRYAVLGSLVTALNKLAVLNNLAVLVTSGCSTRMRSDTGLGAALVPGIGGQEWDGGVWNRLVVFQDFGGRFVGVQKCAGKSLISREEVGEAGKIIAFEIDGHGSPYERRVATSAQTVVAPQPAPKTSLVPKRAFEEIADSEEEDVDEYGWVDTDEHALAMESLVENTQQASEVPAPV